MAREKSEDEKKQSESTPVWEWIIAVVGLILVVGAIGSAFYSAVFSKSTPPILSVTSEPPQPSGDGFIVPFHVKNTGNRTAAAVTIEGELKSGDEVAETSTATLTYSPAHSERGGGLYFTKNPQQFNLQIRATGYQEP